MCGTFSQRDDGRVVIDDWAQKDSSDLRRKPLVYKEPQSSGTQVVQSKGEAKFPGQEVLILMNTTRDEVWLQNARWGLVPHWAKSAEGFEKKTFNARSETVDELASFKDSYAKWRCVIPTDGYWEYRLNENQKKERVKIYNPEGILWLVGIFSVRRKDKQPFSFSVLTSEPGERLAKVHHRKPIMLSQKNEIQNWFDGKSFKELITINEHQLKIVIDPKNEQNINESQISFL